MGWKTIEEIAAERDAALARVATLEAALREIVRHNDLEPFGDCSVKREGDLHKNCRPVITELARTALAAKRLQQQSLFSEPPA